METFTDAVGLWMLRFGFVVINIIDRQIQLVSVAEAQGVIEQWCQIYNPEHPYSRLGFKKPTRVIRFLSDLGRAKISHIHQS